MSSESHYVQYVVTKLFQTDDVIDGMLRNTGELHLADEVQKDDLAALAHGTPAIERRSPITADSRQNFRRRIAAPRRDGRQGSQACPGGDPHGRRAARGFAGTSGSAIPYDSGARSTDEPQEKDATP